MNWRPTFIHWIGPLAVAALLLGALLVWPTGVALAAEPVTRLDSTPSTITKSTSATFAFSSNDSAATYQCKLDAADFAACASPKEYTGLAAGSHTFSVRALDATGSPDLTPESVTWTIDTTPPAVSLTAPASGANVTGNVTISASASDAVGVAYVEFLVNGSFKSRDYSSPYSYVWNSANVADGTATLVVKAYDKAYNSASSADQSVTVDNAPETTIKSGPTGAVKSTSATFGFSANQAGSTFKCKLDAGEYATCTSPHTVSGLSGGSHTFYVVATDTSGYTDVTPASRQWTIDATLPTVSLTAPTEGATLTGTVTLSATASDNVKVSRVEFLVNGQPVGNAYTTPYSYSWSSASIPDGAATIGARAYDSVGNTAAATSRSVAVDNAPETTITSGPSTAVKSSSATFGFSANQTGSTFECRVDSGSYASCTSLHTVSGLGTGPHTFEVRATDPSGYTDATPAKRIWTVDLVAPTASLTAPTAGITVTGSVALAATASDNLKMARVEFLVNGRVVGRDSTAPYSYTWNSATIADGSAAIVARAVDSVGNIGSSASRTVTVDNPPNTTITSGPSGTVTSTSATFKFTANQAGSTFECSLDGASYTSCASAKSYSNLAAGVHTFRVRATDPTGHTDATPATRTWTVSTSVATP